LFPFVDLPGASLDLPATGLCFWAYTNLPFLYDRHITYRTYYFPFWCFARTRPFSFNRIRPHPSLFRTRERASLIRPFLCKIFSVRKVSTRTTGFTLDLPHAELLRPSAYYNLEKHARERFSSLYLEVFIPVTNLRYWKDIPLQRDHLVRSSPRSHSLLLFLT